MKKILSAVLCLLLIFSVCACSNDKEKYAAIAGEYIDGYSQRAVAVVTAEDKSAQIIVSWSSSVKETTVWTMNVKFSGDSKLEYKDCLAEEVVYDDQGKEIRTEIYKDGTGYFELQDGKLAWTGAVDDGCKDCIFELMQ